MTRDVSDLTEGLDLSADLGPEPGTYAAILTNLVPFTYQKDGANETLLEWTFEGKGGFKIREASSLNMGPRSKAFAWMTALLGHKPGRGESIGHWTFDPIKKDWHGDSPLVGLACQVSVVEGDNGYSKIAAVIAPPKG